MTIYVMIDPVSFHVIEVGRLRKTFLDCGGTLRESDICQLRIWVGDDYDHRIETGKTASILRKTASIFPDDSEVLALANKHT